MALVCGLICIPLRSTILACQYQDATVKSTQHDRRVTLCVHTPIASALALYWSKPHAILILYNYIDVYNSTLDFLLQEETSLSTSSPVIQHTDQSSYKQGEVSEGQVEDREQR